MKRNLVAESITIKQMAELLTYAVEWAEDAESNYYRVAAVETVAHMISCWIYQAQLGDSMGACDVLDYLKLNDVEPYPLSAEQWEQRLTDLLKESAQATSS